jgi:hypothetical protein
MELATGAGDVAARSLYEAHGFVHYETAGDPSTAMLCYARDL